MWNALLDREWFLVIIYPTSSEKTAPTLQKEKKKKTTSAQSRFIMAHSSFSFWKKEKVSVKAKSVSFPASSPEPGTMHGTEWVHTQQTVNK